MNEKLALSDDILMKIEKPARYIGNEVNAVVKDLNNIDVRFCMCFPDVYEIGMSHLGIQILYGMLNSWDDVWCERVYSPWVDLDAIMRKENIPLFAQESQDPVKDFECVIRIYCRSWIWRRSRCLQRNVVMIVPLSSVAVPAPIIRNPLQTFSISSISVKARPSIVH